MAKLNTGKSQSILITLALMMPLGIVVGPMAGRLEASTGLSEVWVDDDAGVDGTVLRVNKKRPTRLIATENVFTNYDVGDAVEFISGNAIGKVTTITVKDPDEANKANVQMDLDSAGVQKDDEFNLVDLHTPSPSDPFRYIQSGINMVDSSTVHVATGTYNPDTTIIINKNGLVLMGPQADVDPRPSQGSSRTAGSASEAIIDGGPNNLGEVLHIDADDVIINGLEVKAGTLDVVSQTNAHTGTIVKYNIVHDGNGDDGIQLKECTNCTLEYNYVFDIAFPGDALSIAQNSTNSSIRYNEAYDIHSKNGAIHSYGSTGMEIISNLVRHVTQDDPTRGDGIKLGNKAGHDTSLTGGLIKDNIIYDINGDGITIHMNGVLVQGNEIYNSCSENGGIYLQYAITDIDIQGNSVHDNVFTTSKRLTAAGILLEHRVDAANVTIHFNNIYNNSPYGVTNEATTLLDATLNWWGDVNGPSGVGPGIGDTVSANVDYDPWFADTVKNVTTSAGTDTVDAKNTANTEVIKEGDGTPFVSVARYASNPGGTHTFTAFAGGYIDVHVDDTTGVTAITIHLYYPNTVSPEVGLAFYWWNGNNWVLCSQQGINTTNFPPNYGGYLWAKITSTTKPSLNDLTGKPFVGGSTPIVLFYPHIAIVIFAVLFALATIVYLRRVKCKVQS